MNLPPVFILGPPRSGTTLVRLLLNAHSRVCAPDELIFFGDAVFPRGPKRWRGQPVPRTIVDHFIQHLASRLPGVMESATRAAVERADGDDARSVFVAVMEMLAAKTGKPQWAEKTPGNVFFADVLLEMFPDARFILVERDPRATVASMNRVSFYPADAAANAMNLKHYLAWMRRAKRIIPDGQRLHVRYEDLLADAAPILRSMCRFLGLDYEPWMLDFHRDAAANMDARAVESFNRKATGPMDPANADRWRDKLDADAQTIIEKILGREMVEAGYTPEMAGHALPVRGRLALQAKVAIWRVNRLRSRGRRGYQQREVVLYRSRARLADFGRRLGLGIETPARRGDPRPQPVAPAQPSARAAAPR